MPEKKIFKNFIVLLISYLKLYKWYQRVQKITYGHMQ